MINFNQVAKFLLYFEIANKKSLGLIKLVLILPLLINFGKNSSVRGYL